MITAPVIQAIEASLDQSFKAHVVPETEAYPTSGSTFIRVTGDYTGFEFHEHSIHCVITFSIVCSIRTRDYAKQVKFKPYYELLKLHEQCFFKIIGDQSLISDIAAIAGVSSTIGRFTSDKLNTRVQAVYPNFFASDDVSSTREAGYMLNQSYNSPAVVIPFTCINLPQEIEDQIPTV